MKYKDFLKNFPDISEQELLMKEIMDQIEGGKCTGACAQGCKKKNIKNNNTYPGEKEQ